MQFEAYSRETENVVIMAGYEAERLGDDYIGTEHVLLAFLADADYRGARAPIADPAAEVLKMLGLSRELVKTLIIEQGETVETRRTPAQREGREVARPITKELGACLRLAREGRKNVEPTHLLIEILDDPRTAAAKIVEGSGVPVGTVRTNLAKLGR